MNTTRTTHFPRRQLLLHCAAIASSILLAACAPGPSHVVVHSVDAKPVVIKKGHKHSVKCGHYRHNGHWYFVRGHVHGKRCGHKKVQGVWIVAA